MNCAKFPSLLNSACKKTSACSFTISCFLLICAVSFSNISALDAPVIAPYHPDKAEYFPGVDTLWLGATMYAQSTDSIVAIFVYSAAAWANVLFFMHPETGDTVRVFGFNENWQYEHCPRHPVADTTEHKTYLGNFPRGTELVFMLLTVQPVGMCEDAEYCVGPECGARFTGLNNPLKSRFYSSLWDAEYAHHDNHAWTIMADVDSLQISQLPHPCPDTDEMPVYEATEAPNGGVLFSYEDGCNTTYDDMVFLILNAKLKFRKAYR